MPHTPLFTESSDTGDLGGGTLLTEAPESQDAEFTPTFEGALNGDGTFTEGWTAKAFGPEYHGPLTTTRTFADVDKLLRDNMAAARGRQITWPDEAATPEHLAAIRKLTGAPEKPEGYGDLRPESIPAELWDKSGEARLQGLAHKHHLPPTALKDIMGLYAETLDSAIKANETDQLAQRAAGLQTLKQEFGKDFDAKMHAAKRFAQSLGLHEDNPIFNSAEAVIAMARGAALVSEDRLVSGATQGLKGSPKAQANGIMTDPANPLYAKYQSGDSDTVSLVNSLLIQA
jgi:hypothetical protein